MKKRVYNEEVLLGIHSILIGDGLPSGRRHYTKGCIIVNVGEKRYEEPMYICVEDGCRGKWVAVQGVLAVKDILDVEDVKVDTVTFNKDLAELISDYSNLKLQDGYLDVDLSKTYMTIATIDDPDYAKAEKVVSINGIEIPKTSKLSIGNGNFIEFDQYKVNGNEMQLSVFTLAVAGDSSLNIAAEGFKDIDLNITLENSTEVEKINIIKGAKWQNEKYNIKEIAKNEYEIEIIEPLKPASWTPNLNGGTTWLLFEFINPEGKNMLGEGDQMIYMELNDGVNVSSGIDAIKQFNAEDGSKDYREFMYINVHNDHAYELEYIFSLSNGACKPQKVVIHVPANVPKK
jgi:hypothetical protein